MDSNLTRLQAKNLGLIQFTQWSEPDEIVTTVDEELLMDTWLIRERERVLSAPGRSAAIVQHEKSGKIALFVNDAATERSKKFGKRLLAFMGEGSH